MRGARDSTRKPHARPQTAVQLSDINTVSGKCIRDMSSFVWLDMGPDRKNPQKTSGHMPRRPTSFFVLLENRMSKGMHGCRHCDKARDLVAKNVPEDPAVLSVTTLWEYGTRPEAEHLLPCRRHNEE